LWVTSELSGAAYIVDRGKFVVTGNVSFLPPGMSKSHVTPLGNSGTPRMSLSSTWRRARFLATSSPASAPGDHPLARQKTL
jgi:hypothetical protein